MWIWLIKLCRLICLLGNMSCQEYIHILWTQMRRTSNQWLFLQFSRLTPGPRHWGNVGGHDNGTLCRIPLILWRRHSCRINIQQCIAEFLSTPLLPSETQDEIFPGRLDMLIHMVFFYIFECFSELVYFALNNRKIYLQNGVEYCSNIPN